MQIVSGVGQRAVMRLGFMFLLLAVFAGWFAYDGWVTYPHRNIDAARQSLPKAPDQDPVPHPAVTEESVAALQKSDAAQRPSLTDLRKQWGEPAYLGPAGTGGTAGEQVAYFVGPYGSVRAVVQGETASKIEWHEGAKAASDILVQRVLGLGLGLGALVPLVLLLVQMSRKYQLDDDGMVLPEHGRIRYDQMTGMDAKEFTAKGVVLLKYRDSQNQDKTAVLDEEKIAKFEEIVAALCEKKDWPIEVEPEEEES